MRAEHIGLSACVTSAGVYYMITNCFSGPGWAVSQSYLLFVCVCVYMQIITFQVADDLARYAVVLVHFDLSPI